MSIYSLKMRASRHENGTQEHVSGAEKILRASELTAQMDALLQRALHHAKGKADFINLKIEEIQPDDLQYIDALPVSTYEATTADEGRKAMAEGLTEVGISPEKAEKIMSMFKDTYSMRGAMLLDADTLERLEPDHARGIRATYMDAEHSASRSASDCKNHFQEAIVLASKVISAPHIIAELCMSDDPDYVTGYIATRSKGYMRITKLKPMGCPDGGRIFLYRGPHEDVAACIRYLQEQHVLVRNVPEKPVLSATPDYATAQSSHSIIHDTSKKNKNDSRFGSFEVSQFLLQLIVQGQGAGGQPGAAGAGAIAVCGGFSGSDYLRMVDEAKIIIGSQHQMLFAVTGNVGCLGGGNFRSGTVKMPIFFLCQNICVYLPGIFLAVFF